MADTKFNLVDWTAKKLRRDAFPFIIFAFLFGIAVVLFFGVLIDAGFATGLGSRVLFTIFFLIAAVIVLIVTYVLTEASKNLDMDREFYDLLLRCFKDLPLARASLEIENKDSHELAKGSGFYLSSVSKVERMLQDAIGSEYEISTHHTPGQPFAYTISLSKVKIGG